MKNLAEQSVLFSYGAFLCRYFLAASASANEGTLRNQSCKHRRLISAAVSYSTGERFFYQYNPDYDSYGEEYGTGSSWTYTEYVYDKYGTLRESYIGFNLTGEYYYDALGRPVTVKYDEIDTGYSYLDKYTYVEDTALVSSHTKTVKNSLGNTVSVKTVGYEYDNNGNITKITDGSSQITYQYDNLNQLIRENNSGANKTVKYTYDSRGNITSKKEYAYTTSSYLGTPLHSYTYSYSTGAVKDQLVSYNGSGITYDNVGNPVSYMGKIMTWTMGRNLGKVTVGSKEYFYKYDGEGLRVSKEYTSGGSNITIKYLYDGVRLLEEYGSRNIQFLYDGGNTPIGFQYGGNTYYYNKNIFGDVIGIFDTNLNTVVTYAYDSWGKLLSIKSANGVDVTNNTSGIGYINPIRYRGYYYDNETGFYYLQSRYYDPNTSRFINADGQLTTGSDLTGLNLFAYCGNNPVNRVDPTGEAWWHWAIGAAVVAACAVATVVTCGGFAAAATAVCLVANGVAAATTASTIAAGALIGSATVYGMAVLTAAATSDSLQEFNDQGNWGTVAATVGGAVLGGGSAYLSTRTPTTKVYRSVSDAEAQDIKATGQFNLIPGGMESKQFGFDFAETKQFGNLIGQNTIVRAEVPTNMLNQFYTGGVDTSIFRNGTLTVYGDQLDAFNQAISGTIRFMP